MPTDKQLLIDLTALTPESTSQLASMQEDFVKELEKSGKRTKPQAKKKLTAFEKQDEKTQKRLDKLQKQLEFESISGKGKKGIASKIFGDKASLKNVVQMGLNPQGFMGGLLKKGIPGFGAAVSATAIIVAILKKVDDLQKRFTDQILTKTREDRDNENIARVQAGLAQDITSPAPGIYDPRDVYNSLDESNDAVLRREEDYTIRNTSGVE